MTINRKHSNRLWTIRLSSTCHTIQDTLDLHALSQHKTSKPIPDNQTRTDIYKQSHHLGHNKLHILSQHKTFKPITDNQTYRHV